jgi:hypothetical protein
MNGNFKQAVLIKGTAADDFDEQLEIVMEDVWYKLRNAKCLAFTAQ